MYDKDNKEYFALPIDVVKERGIQIEKGVENGLNGDLEIDVEIEGKPVKFLAIPFDTVKRRHIEIPEIEIVDHDIPIGLKGDYITKQFTKVTWKKVTDEFTKKYDIKGHIVIAGCKPSETVKTGDEEGKDKDGEEKFQHQKLQCTEKEIFSVLHPMEEFLEDHIGDIEEMR
jgi:hypothetical protein